MPKSSILETYTDNLYTNKTLNFFLDLNEAQLPDASISELAPLLSEALRAMQNLENGAIANPDENRPVGHYWLRNHKLAPTVEIQNQISDTISSIKSFSAAVHQGQLLNPKGGVFTQILLIGIGGSALGPQFIADALDHKSGMKISFLDNTDPDGIDHVLADLSDVLSETLVIVISKSGGTAETRNGMLETQNVFINNGLDFSRQAVAVTGQDSQLYKIASQDNWLSISPCGTGSVAERQSCLLLASSQLHCWELILMPYYQVLQQWMTLPALVISQTIQPPSLLRPGSYLVKARAVRTWLFYPIRTGCSSSVDIYNN